MKYFNSCMCCSLRVGNIVYAIFAIIVGFMDIIVMSIILAYFDFDRMKNFGLQIPRGVVIARLVFSIFGEVPNILLLYGVLKKMPKLMIPYMIIFGITMVLQFVLVISAFVGGNFSMGIGFLLLMALFYLFFHCVVSYFKELQQVTPNNVDSNRNVFSKV